MNYEWCVPSRKDWPVNALLVELYVRMGDLVKQNQPLLAIDIGTLAAGIPCPVSGRVAIIHASPGDELRPGELVITFEDVDPSTIPPTH